MMTKEDAFKKIIDAEGAQERFRAIAEAVDTFKPISEVTHQPITKESKLVEGGASPLEGKKHLPSLKVEITFETLTFIVDGHRIEFPAEETCYVLEMIDAVHMGFHESLSDIIQLMFQDVMDDPEKAKEILGRILTNRN